MAIGGPVGYPVAMTESDLVRRLTTIMDIDVVGFSTMSSRDEEHALALLTARMGTAQALVRQHRGRVFKLTGDGLLAEFASPVEAVRAALEIQEAMRAANDPAPPADQMVLRIGVNLGDVVESGDDLMGDAVNVAARLESIAPAGGICVSAAVYEQIQGKLTLGAEDLGEQHVKNIPRAIHAYRLTLDGVPVAPVVAPRVTHAAAATPAAPPRPAGRLAAILGSAAVVAGLALGGAWWLHQTSPPPPTPAAPRQATALPSAAPTAPQPAPSPATPAAAPPAAPPASTAETPPLDQPTATAELAPPIPLAEPPRRRPFVVEEVPFVSEFHWRRLHEYRAAEGAKALAISVRGWMGMAFGRIDSEIARRVALEDCNATVEREVRVRRPYDRCMIYAEGNEVVWSFHPPPMPPLPHIPPTLPSPPIPFDAAAVPLVTPQARRNLAEHYAVSRRHRALVLGPNRFDWWTPSVTAVDAVRRTLQICGHLSNRPCVVYAIDDTVLVRVPQRHRVTDIFTPQEVLGLAGGNRGEVERYLVSNDWRAIAMGTGGRLGIVSGRASEDQAVAEALAACAAAGGENCKLLAIGPFVVDPG